MRSYVVFFSGFCAVLLQIMGQQLQIPNKRIRRNAVGALEIITNNEKPIHAEVKAESVSIKHGDSIASISTTPEMLPYPRVRRDAAGALDIVNNNGKPIHAEVKLEQGEEPSTSTNTSNSAKDDNSASNSTTTEKLTQLSSPVQNVSTTKDITVTPPKDVTRLPEELYSSKSLRKSWPLTNRLDLIRSVSRIFTLTVVFVSGAVEFYSLLQHLLKAYGYF